MKTIFFLFFCFSFVLILKAQEVNVKEHQKGYLSVASEIGVSMNRFKPKHSSFAPTINYHSQIGLSSTYKLSQSPLGFYTGLRYTQFRIKELKVNYLRIPVKMLLLIGKRVKIIVGGGLVNNISVGSKTDNDFEGEAFYLDSKKRYTIAGIVCFGFSYSINEKLKFGLIYDYATSSAPFTSEYRGASGYHSETISAKSHALYLRLDYVLFTRVNKK